MTPAELARWKQKRNEALIVLDIDYARGLFPGASSDYVLLIGLHKARYECKDLAAELRHASCAWLRERGFGRIQGPLLPEGELPE